MPPFGCPQYTPVSTSAPSILQSRNESERRSANWSRCPLVGFGRVHPCTGSRAGFGHACFLFVAAMVWTRGRLAWFSAQAAPWALILDARASRGATVRPRVRA